MNFALDLTRRHWTAVHGDITAIGTWMCTGGRWRPALVLLRTFDEGRAEAVPCIVPMDTAWVWEEHAGDPARAAQMAFQFARGLRLTEDPKTIIRIASLVQDHLGDLLHIPPYQAPDQHAAAEIVVRNNRTGQTIEAEVMDG